MGDYRLDVVIKLTGIDGKQRKKEAWVNWDRASSPMTVIKMLEDIARDSQLQFDWPSEYDLSDTGRVNNQCKSD